MKKKDWRPSSLGLLAGGLLVIAATASAVVFAAPKISYIRTIDTTVAETTPGSTSSLQAAKPAAQHLTTPNPVKAIYMTECAVGTPSLRDSLVKLIDTTELNAVVIDIRDYTGKISFPTDDPLLKEYISDQCGAKDMRSFVKMLHDKNIYVIGRITTFQNPAYAKAHPEQAVQKVGGGVWHDYKGLAFVDVGAKPYWESVVELGKISYGMGFDELNFDYLRFPSDGPMKEADYSWDKGKSKAQALEEFYQYLHDGLKPTDSTGSPRAAPILSADLFGYVTVHTDDLGIGQVLERAFAYFDYIDPMVYPSHYNSGFAGLANVNSDPYKVVKVSLEEAVARATATTTTVDAMGETPIMKTMIVPASATSATTTKEVESGLYTKPVFPASIIRPWLQAFDYPVTYTPAMVEDQIKATHDSGLSSYLLWDAANKYRSLRGVLRPVDSNLE
jgi:hypothetical protein